jgi:hypothetical protein
MNIKRTLVVLTLTILFVRQVSGQTNLCDKVDKELTQIYSKIFPFYYGDLDSLIYYSDLFSTKLTTYVKSDPSTIECSFKSFSDSIGSVVTTSDGLFRIYSWDTWTGGTMRNYKNLFQYKSEGKVYVKVFDYGEGDMGTYFTKVYSLKGANNKTYLLTFSGGTESSAEGYESISFYSISGDTLNDKVPLLKTSNGFETSISIEYDFSSVNDGSQLIKYDSEHKIIYVPIASDQGKITEKFSIYKFTGQYFEKIDSRKLKQTEK